MITFRRYLLAFLIAAVVVNLMMAMMVTLIKTSEMSVDQNNSAVTVDFIRAKKDPSLELEKLKPEPPPQPQSPPPPAAIAMDTVPVAEQTFAVATQSLDFSLSTEPGVFSGEGSDEYLPIYRVPPQYPRQALMDRVEGWVLVEFTISTRGEVKNARVVDSQPQGVFDNAALSAVQRFRFKPQTLAGEPIEVEGVQNRLRFRLKQ